MSAQRSPWKTRYFLDTECTDFEVSHLISVPIVAARAAIGCAHPAGVVLG
jgi:hypothetical protein